MDIRGAKLGVILIYYKRVVAHATRRLLAKYTK